MGIRKHSHGGRIPFSNIAVDFWKPQASIKFYFLTHVHSDHLEGLHPQWNGGTIYCTQTSKKYLAKIIGLKPDSIVALELNTPTEILVDTENKISVRVTAIDSNHCAGSVMYLFQGYFGSLLWTGDFRYYPSIASNPALQGIVIDKLYLDNTFCDPKFDFPSLDDATTKILNIIKDHSGHNILLGLDTIGKEELLVAIVRAFNTKVIMTPKRMAVIEVIEYIPEDIFTLTPTEGFVRFVSKKAITPQRLADLNQNHPTIGIIPTGWADCVPWAKNVPSSDGKQHIFYVPYSSHSSFSEITEFVKQVQPRKITPLVKNKFMDVQTHFSHLLNKTPSEPFEPPEGIYATAYGHTFYDEDTQFNQTDTTGNVKDLKANFKPNAIIMESDDDSQLEYVDLESSVVDQTMPKHVAEMIKQFYPSLQSEAVQAIQENLTVVSKIPEETMVDLEKWTHPIDELMSTSDTDHKLLNPDMVTKYPPRHYKELSLHGEQPDHDKPKQRVGALDQLRNIALDLSTDKKRKLDILVGHPDAFPKGVPLKAPKVEVVKKVIPSKTVKKQSALSAVFQFLSAQQHSPQTWRNW